VAGAGVAGMFGGGALGRVVVGDGLRFAI
jgi:hypothetical protein